MESNENTLKWKKTAIKKDIANESDRHGRPTILFTSFIYLFLTQPDSVVEAAVEKINSLLESFMGINDSDLGNNRNRLTMSFCY